MIPTIENVPLARPYTTVDIDEEIPVERYGAVAEVIGHVMGSQAQPPWQAPLMEGGWRKKACKNRPEMHANRQMEGLMLLPWQPRFRQEAARGESRDRDRLEGRVPRHDRRYRPRADAGAYLRA